MIVVDTDVVAYLLIEGDKTQQARAVYEREGEWGLPPLWRSEFLNVLTLAVRADVLDDPDARQAWRRASALLRTCEIEPKAEDVLTLALRDGLSAYDAQFVCVAEDLNTKLITEDERILKARPDIALTMATFAAAP